MTQLVNGVPKASLQAPSRISQKSLHQVMEIRAAFHPLFVTKIFYQGSFVWLRHHYFDGIGDLQ